MFSTILWDASPEIIDGWSMPNWYGLSWAFSFILGYQIIKKIFKKENAPQEWTDKILFYMLIAGILGARLGHCFFYDPQYYLSNPIEILKIWEGGLASHGGAIGILIALFIFSKKVTKQSMFWILDRVVICVAIASCFIRFGNLVNHEIVGHPSSKGLAMVFTKNVEDMPQALANAYQLEAPNIEFEKLEGNEIFQEEVECNRYRVDVQFTNANKKDVETYKNDLMFRYTDMTEDNQLERNVSSVDLESFKIKRTQEGQLLSYEAYLIPRHPAQLYEAISYLVLFLLLALMYWKGNAGMNYGVLFGTYLIIAFGSRFIIEYVKVKQTDLSSDWSLNMGHILSIPFVVIGIACLIYGFTKGKGRGALVLPQDEGGDN